MKEQKTVTVTFDADIFSEFERIVRLHKQYGAPNSFETPQNLIDYVLCSIADGSRRPGSWERQMLEMMGIVAECDDHAIYQDRYGAGNMSDIRRKLESEIFDLEQQCYEITEDIRSETGAEYYFGCYNEMSHDDERFDEIYYKVREIEGAIADATSEIEGKIAELKEQLEQLPE